MKIKTLALAATAAALLAAPLQANPAASLSLSARAGEAVEGENALFGGLIGSVISIGVSLLSAYLVYELIDDEPESA
ncbi:hypothetical protein [Allosphingosinicella vermicomposti]|uniref:hypothetical protein n=1 Tax=Allosphingosinicella vermicomposti TaxID=614671 RepID=UPI000D0F78D1|nr:hypothetical protein [Allosphingosinicella vermicomposti]